MGERNRRHEALDAMAPGFGEVTLSVMPLVMHLARMMAMTSVIGLNSVWAGLDPSGLDG